MDKASNAGLSAALAAQLLAVRFAQLPHATVRAAARALLDATGVMRAASGLSPEAAPFIVMARAQGGPAEARVLGCELRVPASLAALANGALAHALDYEDAFDAAAVHPNASLVPAVLALADADPSIDGRAVLAAIAVGCEMSCRIALSLGQPLEDGGWYPPPILGAWGAVAGCAHLLRLSPRQLLDAWSLLLLQTSTPGEIKHAGGSTLRAVRESFPAQAAVQVVRLAAHGVPGFAAPLEGRDGFFRLFAGGRYDTQALLARPDRWHIEELSFKPWPSCRGTHAAIECALRIRAALDGDFTRIARIVVEGGEVQQMLALPAARKQAPEVAIEAKFSLPFTVAAALCDGTVTLDTFSSSRLVREDLRQLAARVDFECRGDWGRAQAACGALRVTLTDGTMLRQQVLEPRGSPARALSDEELLAKFVDCCARARHPLPRDAAEALAQRLLCLEAEPSLAALPL
jgi:2-methylcitrate dehydratase PrpD